MGRLNRHVTVAIVSSPEGVMPAIRHSLESHGYGAHSRLAEHLGCSKKHLSQMMLGKAGVSLQMLFEMLEYLEIAMVLSPEEKL